VSRVFDLPPDFLDAPSITDVEVIGAMMLIPQDDGLRARMLGDKWLERTLRTGRYPSPRTPEEYVQLNDLIRAPRRDDQRAIQAGYVKGMVAGNILLKAIWAAKAGKPEPVGPTKDRLAKDLWRVPGARGISVFTIDKSVWPDYRCVSPYWAAYQHLRLGERAGLPIPCSAGELGYFLAIADEIRLHGEVLHTPQSPDPTLLRPGETVALPAGIKLQPRRIIFS
jgi:hypothetical protein